MELFKADDSGRFSLAIPITKYNESTGEFEAWATVEQLDKSGEIIDIDKSFPYFEAHSKKFSEATGGQSFGNVREQHDPKKAAGKLIAPPEIRKHESGARGVYIKGLAVDPLTKEKLATRVLVGVSIGGSYVGEAEKVTIAGRDAKKYTANPSEYSLVDNPCVPDALITVVKADGKEEIGKAVGFNPLQGFECRAGAFHMRKDDARKCESDHEDELVEKITASERNALPESDFAIPAKRKYPIDTKARARNALARVSQFGTPEEKAEVRAAVHGKYPDVGADKTQKQTDDEVLQKCLSCVSQMAYIIANAEGLASWLENVESQDDDDTAELEIADKIKEATSTLYDALREIVDDCQADAQGYKPEAVSGGGNTNAEMYTDNTPVVQMTALIGELKKRSTITKMLSKSLRVHTGNGSSSSLTKEDAMSDTKKEEKAAPVEKTEERKAEKSAEGELSKAATDQIAKAVSDGLSKALEPISTKVDAIEKAQKAAKDEQDAINDRTSKLFKAMIDRAAPTKAIKRVTKAEDGKDESVDHSKAVKSDKEPTALQKMAAALENPQSVQFGRLVPAE